MHDSGPQGVRLNLSLALLTLVLFVTFLDNTVIAVALASIQVDLHAGISALQWIVNGYALTFAALMLTFGTLGDRLGRRKLMVFGLVVFTAGSVLGAVSTSSGMLIGARVVMGVGAAASEPGTLSMIRQLWHDPAERAQALGVWAAISGLALAAGPVLGGLLIGLWSWRGIFVFNCAVGVAAVVGVRLVIPESADPASARLDVPGFAYGATGLTAATFATIEGETHGYRTWWVLAIYAFGLICLAVFVRNERVAAQPVLDLSYFRKGAFTAGIVVAFTGFFATFAVFFFIPLYIQLLGMQSSYSLVLDFLPMAAALIVSSALSGRWIGRVGSAVPIAIGSLMAGTGIFVTDALVKPSSTVGLLGWSLTLVGAGLGIVMVGATASVLGEVPPERSGMAASAVNTSRELGAVAGVSVLGAIINGQLTTNLQARLNHIPGLPAALRNEVIVAITTGAVNTKQDTLPTTGPIAKIVDEVLDAANKSFSQGLNLVLVLAGLFLVLSGVGASLIARRQAAASLAE